MAQDTQSESANGDRPWHQPGKWLVNPAYWDAETLKLRADAFVIKEEICGYRVLF